MECPVNVLLSTYNGLPFVTQLLESVSGQSYKNCFVTVRDDGSTDGTYEKLCEYSASRSNVRLMRGTNLGAVQSFFTLLLEGNPQCEYFAFCDQDDVWLPRKIADAVSILETYNAAKPVMYCSRVRYVDANLRHIGYSKIPKRMGFANALVENVATGCTVVINRAGREILLQQTPRNVLMHDWWCYLVFSALGNIVFDPRTNILYRQHGKNAIGVASNIWEQYRRRVVRFLAWKPGDPKLLRQQALEFYGYYRNLLKEDDLSTLERLITPKRNIVSRVVYAVCADLWRQSWMDDALLRILICMDRI